MTYILAEVMEDSIFVIDSIPVEFIIFPKCILDKIDNEIIKLISTKEYENLSHLYECMRYNLSWMGEVDIMDIVQNRIIWNPIKIDVIKIF